MPWKETHVTEERMSFVSRLRTGERMSDLCSEYGISRKTGYKVLARFEQDSAAGLLDRRPVPLRIPHRTPEPTVALIRELRLQHPTWGAKKLKAYLERHQPGVRIPAASTVGDILERQGLVSRCRRRRRPLRLQADKLRKSERPNEVWSIDFKGQFRLGNGKRCFPLTVTDHYSRAYLGLEALDDTTSLPVEAAMSRVFEVHGLPDAIRSDNGVPFASTSLGGLSRLSVWWMKLGIVPERIDPGKPQQNGRHERSHLTLKQETARPAANNSLAQQERFDDWLTTYNRERPHEALDMKTPWELYAPSRRKLPDALPTFDYALYDDVMTVNRGGRISFGRAKKCCVGAALAGETVGVREVGPDCWLVAFLTMELGVYDRKNNRFTPNDHLSFSPHH